jgi:hypothetical protein
MTVGMRLRIATTALALGLVAAPAAAQNQVAPVTPAPAPSGEVIGPPQLQDFNLNGTVTRRAEPRATQPQTGPQPATARTAPAPAPATGTADRTEQASRQPEPRPQPAVARETAEQAAETNAPVAVRPDFSVFGAPPTAAAEPAAFSPPADLPPVGPATGPGEGSAGFSPLPWILALLAAGAAAAWYFRRQRPRLAAAGSVSEFVAPQPEPEPKPEPVRRAPLAAPTVPKGVVSTGLRPWLDINFTPERCEFREDGATIEFVVNVTNSGSAPARDVLVEAVMVNAGEAQDKELGSFFARPTGAGDRIPAIGPLKSLPLRHAVTLTREQMRVYQAGDRSVFVPVIAFNALYRHNGGEAQTSAAWMVGRATRGDKMGPFRADQGPRAFAGLAARQLETMVRN